MKELLFNPVVILAFGITLGIALKHYYNYFSLANGSSNCMQNDFTMAQSKIISPAKAQEMYNSYTTRRASLIEREEGSGFETTRFGTIDFAIIKNYIGYLDCIDSKLRDDDTNDTNGIESLRIYFANYPDQFGNGAAMQRASIDGTTYSYAGRNTFFMLPTLISGNQSEKGFMLTGGQNNLEYETIEAFLKDNTDDAIRNSEVGSLILNEVGLTPPPPVHVPEF